MALATCILLLPLLAVIIYQDVRYRMISWIPLPFIFAGGISLGFSGMGRDFINQSLLINIALLGFQLVLLTVFFSIPKGKPLNITSRHIGTGDILFLLAATSLFSPVNYVVYYSGSLSLSLAIAAFSKKRPGSVYSVPLAGVLAFAMMIALVTEIINGPLLYDDKPVLTWLLE